MDYIVVTEYMSLTINLMALFVLIVVIYGNTFELKIVHNKSHQKFVWYCLSLLAGVLTDILSYIGDIQSWPLIISETVTALSFIFGEVITLFFVLYVIELIRERRSVPKPIFHLSILICVIAVLIDTYFSVTGGYFTFSNGVYAEGPYIQVTTIMSIVINVWLLVVTLHFVKALGIHDLIAIAAYIVIPACGSVVYMLTSVSVEYAAMIMAMLVIFVMIQADIQKRADVREKKLVHASKVDQMTGLFNRGAHDVEIANLTQIPYDFVYVSFDLNGLKMTNDTFGHSAGDELIIGGANCIKDCFGRFGNLYRIGGDEFAAILIVDDIALRNATKQFEEQVRNWSGKQCHNLSVSYGVASIREFSHVKKVGIKELQTIADGRMYKYKADYYQKKGC